MSLLLSSMLTWALYRMPSAMDSMETSKAMDMATAVIVMLVLPFRLKAFLSIISFTLYSLFIASTIFTLEAQKAGIKPMSIPMMVMEAVALVRSEGVILAILNPSGSPVATLSAYPLTTSTPMLPKMRPMTNPIKHMRTVDIQLRDLRIMLKESRHQELMAIAREYKVSYALIVETAKLGRLPVVNFAAGGIATPADAAQMMTLGCDGVFVGSGVFKSDDPAARAESIVIATTYWDHPDIVVEAQQMIDETKSMSGMDLESTYRMQDRGAEI